MNILKLNFLPGLLALACLASLPAQAENSPVIHEAVQPENVQLESNSAVVQRLVKKLSGLENLSGEFSQTVKDADGRLNQESSGRYKMKRPGLLLWETLLPFPQQLIVNQDYIWLYDADLEQATRREVGDSLRETPILLLTGNAEQVISLYEVAAKGEPENETFILTPLNTQSGILQWSLSFSQSTPLSIRLKDSLGQITQIDLPKASLNMKVMSKGLFEFIPPAGTDIVADS